LLLGSTLHLRDTTLAPLALASPVYHQHSMRMGLARNQARNHNETTTKPLTKPLVFSYMINETGGFYKQLIRVPQLYLSETPVSLIMCENTSGFVGGFVVVSLWRRACGDFAAVLRYQNTCFNNF
jgi:hypothetical protein